MRTVPKTIIRREHWRWQRCGKSRSELRRVLVRETRVRLGPADARQLDLLESRTGGAMRRKPARRVHGHAARTVETRPVLRSYWRRQPFGPGSLLRKTILVDVHG